MMKEKTQQPLDRDDIRAMADSVEARCSVVWKHAKEIAAVALQAMIERGWRKP